MSFKSYDINISPERTERMNKNCKSLDELAKTYPELNMVAGVITEYVAFLFLSNDQTKEYWLERLEKKLKEMRNTKEEIKLKDDEICKQHKTKSNYRVRKPVKIDWNEYDEYYKKGSSIPYICKKMVDKRTEKKISKSAFYKAVRNRI